LVISAGKTIIRGLVINRFSGNGIKLQANGANRIEGNFIGTDPRGTVDQGNGQFGVSISGSSNNTVGGAQLKMRNVISGNDVSGIYLTGGAAGNRVQGNFIGTDSSGGAALGNSVDGVTIYNAANNTIGGTVSSLCNTISANNGNGVQILGGGATGNRLQGNFIGTKSDGFGALGNNQHGVSINFLPTIKTAGGTERGAGNRIFSNGGHGVSVASGTGNAILSNSISANAGLGIDLGNDGVTPNDPCDTDTGANNRQNTAQLNLLFASGGGLTIQVKLDVAPASVYRIEFFASDICDPSGSGEGQNLITAVSVVSSASCLQTFNFLVGPGVVPSGHVVTATITDAAGNTSEFSNCVVAP